MLGIKLVAYMATDIHIFNPGYVVYPGVKVESFICNDKHIVSTP